MSLEIQQQEFIQIHLFAFPLLPHLSFYYLDKIEKPQFSHRSLTTRRIARLFLLIFPLLCLIEFRV